MTDNCTCEAAEKLKAVRRVIDQPFADMLDDSISTQQLKILQLSAKGKGWQGISAECDGMQRSTVYYHLRQGLSALSGALGYKVEQGDLTTLYHDLIEEAVR